MRIIEHTHNQSKIAEIVSPEVIIRETQDALDIMGNCTYNGIHKIIVYQHQLHPDFFDLKSRIAGEILQKFSTYRVQLAIVGEFTDIESKSLNDFIRESNRIGWTIFTASKEEAMEKLGR